MPIAHPVEALRTVIKKLAQIVLAFLTEEHCRFCQRYIDQLGWIERCYASMECQERPNDTAPSNWSAPPARFKVPLTHQAEFISAALCQPCVDALLAVKPLLEQYETQAPGKSNGEACSSRQLLVACGIEYNEPMKRLIRRCKYDKDELLAGDLCALMLYGWPLLEQQLAGYIESNAMLVVPVPLHWRRRYKRGYNQATLIATEAARMLKLPLAEEALRRSKMTLPQNKLSREARQRNLADAFSGNKKLLANKCVLLIDDVCTSGATLLECSREAYRCGATCVYAMTVARAVLVLGTTISSSANLTQDQPAYRS